MNLWTASVVALLEKKRMLSRREIHPEDFILIDRNLTARLRVNGVDIRREFGCDAENRIRKTMTRFLCEHVVNGGVVFVGARRLWNPGIYSGMATLQEGKQVIPDIALSDGLYFLTEILR